MYRASLLITGEGKTEDDAIESWLFNACELARQVECVNGGEDALTIEKFESED